VDNWIKEKIGCTAERLSLKDIEEYRLQKLRATLDHALRHSPFYQKHLQYYSDNGLKDLADFKNIPFTTPEDIRDQGLQMLCVSQSEIERVVTLDSSGTTGKPKRLYFTAEDQKLTVDFFMQGMSLLTSPGDKVLILMPGERPGGIGDLLATALERIGAIPVKHGFVTDLKETLEIISRDRINVLVGVPIQVLALAKYYEWTGGAKPLALKKMLLSTDYVPQATVDYIQKVWGCEVFRYYGMTEMGLGGGIECSKHNGFHLHVADFFLEVIHPATGEVLPEGEYGEVVLTTLTRKGMPLIRYRTGDLSRYLPGNCPCQWVTPRLENIKARKSGVVHIAPDCSLTIADLDESLLSLPRVVDFSATVYSDSGQTILELEIKSLGKKVGPTAIRDRLFLNKSLQWAENKGKLKVIVKEVCYTDDFIPIDRKRVIKILYS